MFLNLTLGGGGGAWPGDDTVYLINHVIDLSCKKISVQEGVPAHTAYIITFICTIIVPCFEYWQVLFIIHTNFTSVVAP